MRRPSKPPCEPLSAAFSPCAIACSQWSTTTSFTPPSSGTSAFAPSPPPSSALADINFAAFRRSNNEPPPPPAEACRSPPLAEARRLPPPAPLSSAPSESFFAAPSNPRIFDLTASDLIFACSFCSFRAFTAASFAAAFSSAALAFALAFSARLAMSLASPRQAPIPPASRVSRASIDELPRVGNAPCQLFALKYAIISVASSRW
mmetsp:Transcript_41136/g.113057  ORF Transcript_41136/g.113057 Transcript_41136/m.113057 type:complete len:205 (+) Transcript_41136:204-818(+)